jgi:hypothetical protein
MPEYEDGGYIKKSRKIGSFFKKVGVFLITIIVVHFVIDLTFESIILSIWNIDYETISVWITTGNYAMLLLYQAITGIPRALLYGPLLVCLLTSLFAEDLKEYRIETGSQQFYMEREETRGQEPSKLKEGMFCPFCGAKINEKQNYCPKCGESLDFIT